MPTYDYQCDACDHSFELFQGINDPVKRKCPACGKNKLRRLFGTGAAIVFRGSGFYQTDYRSDGYKKAAKADKAASSGNAEGGSGKESKAEGAKSETSKSESSKTPASGSKKSSSSGD